MRAFTNHDLISTRQQQAENRWNWQQTNEQQWVSGGLGAAWLVGAGQRGSRLSVKKTKDQCDHDKHKKTGEAEANLGPAAQRNQQQLAAGPYITQKKKKYRNTKKKNSSTYQTNIIKVTSTSASRIWLWHTFSTLQMVTNVAKKSAGELAKSKCPGKRKEQL